MSELSAYVAALRAAAEPTRLRILLLLARGELTVSEICQVLGQSQPRVSRHLKQLADAGLVSRLPEGTWVFYRIAGEGDAHASLVHAITDLAPTQDAALDLDRARLAAVKRQRAEHASHYFSNAAEDWERIRALHLPERQVEEALLKLAKGARFSTHVDIGTGTARMLSLFADQTGRGVGVDLSHNMLNVARANLHSDGLKHCSVQQADLYALPFASGYADLVTIHQVLHYLDDPALAIFEAARILRKGGALMVVDFASHTLEELREAHAHRRLGFADADIARWFEAAGLKSETPVSLQPESGQQTLTVKIWRGQQTTMPALQDAEKGSRR